MSSVLGKGCAIAENNFVCGNGRGQPSRESAHLRASSLVPLPERADLLKYIIGAMYRFRGRSGGGIMKMGLLRIFCIRSFY